MTSAITDEELVEAGLPDLAGISAAGHVALDEEKVAVAKLVVGGVVTELCHPGGDDSVEEATIGVIHAGWGAVVVGATNVDGSLVGEKGRADGGDDTVGDVIGAAGVGLAGVEGGGLALSDSDAELVGDISTTWIPCGVGLAGEGGDDETGGGT